MQNKKFIDSTKHTLKELLSQCTESQKLLFKRMYSHKNLNLDVNKVVDNPDKLIWAIKQVERSVVKNTIVVHSKKRKNE